MTASAKSTPYLLDLLATVMLVPVLCTALMLTAPTNTVTIPTAGADGCSDVEVLFARGTGEAPGVGKTGQIFVDDLRNKLGGRSLGVYGVNYPANRNWPTAMDGIRDAADHIKSVASMCPATRMVLGGFSQGAAVMGFVTSDSVPASIDPSKVPEPLSPALADHIAAVVLFGTPNTRMMDILRQPPVVIGPLYADKTIELCTQNDPVCSSGTSPTAHNAYDQQGLIEQGAAFAAQRL